MAKFYGYTYDGSPLAHQRPLSEEKMLATLEQGKHVADPDKYQIYELVPVKKVRKTVITFERTSS